MYLMIEVAVFCYLQELDGKIKRLLNRQQPNNRDSGIFDNIHDPNEVLWAKSKLNRYN